MTAETFFIVRSCMQFQFKVDLSLDTLVKTGEIHLTICHIGLCCFVQVEVFYEFSYCYYFLKNGPLRNHSKCFPWYVGFFPGVSILVRWCFET